MTPTGEDVRARRLGALLACLGEQRLDEVDECECSAGLFASMHFDRRDFLAMTEATPDDLALATACVDLARDVRDAQWDALQRLLSLPEDDAAERLRCEYELHWHLPAPDA